MAIDVDRIVQAAAQAVLEDQDSGRRSQKRPAERKGKRLSAPRAVLIGAGAVTAGRLLARARGGDLLDRLQQRLTDLDEGEELEADEGYDEDELDEEPQAERSNSASAAGASR